MKKDTTILSLMRFSAGLPNREILHSVNLIIKRGEIHAIMGPNGSGKSTLAMSMMGHPGYEIKNGVSKLAISESDLIPMTPEERARAGLFVSFQSPVEITGVSLLAFLRTAYKELHPEKKMKLSEFKIIVTDALSQVGLDNSFMHRSINEGFSGGERKRCEIVQLIVLKPKVAILDEIDSGLDVDSLRLVAKAIEKTVKKNKLSVLLITHYQRILHLLRPDKVHVLINGEIKKTGKMSLVKKIEKDGYVGLTN